jgi:hypothetical protein
MSPGDKCSARNGLASSTANGFRPDVCEKCGFEDPGLLGRYAVWTLNLQQSRCERLISHECRLIGKLGTRFNKLYGVTLVCHATVSTFATDKSPTFTHTILLTLFKAAQLVERFLISRQPKVRYRVCKIAQS